jgi:hypothetical protein
MFRIFAAALAVLLFSAGASEAREWVRLGDRNVGFLGDHDSIHVGRHDGKFVRLKLLVRRNDIMLNSVKVIFGNGEVEVIAFQQHIRDGGEAVIPLPHGWHEGRFIREVELHYHSRPDFRGEALAELWGQEDDDHEAPMHHAGAPMHNGGSDWVRLGDRNVGFLSDHDSIHVGGREGKFVRLKLLVRRNDIMLNSVKVIFGNGEVEVIPFQQHIHDGGEAVIPLPHGFREGRFIREVELHYHSRPDFRGEALAELWGKED